MKIAFSIGAVLLYVVGAALYLQPGFSLMWEGNLEFVMSDGTDPTALPQQFSFILDYWKNSPLELLFGAIYSPFLGAPEGSAVWTTLGDRLMVPVLSIFMPVEQISTGLAFVAMILDGVIMFALARAMNIPRSVSWGMGASWAFCAYTRARAKVHMGLVGIYHLPLVFLALWWASRKEKMPWPLLAFLVVVSVPHYYIIMLLPFFPFLLLFAWWVRNPEERVVGWLTRLVGLALPAILWLIWSVAMPLSPSASQQTRAFPATGETKTGEYHPFTNIFAARVVDYFTGDLALGGKDLNPLKETLNVGIIRDRYEGSNAHERALGVRWLLWILGTVGLIHLMPSQKRFWTGVDRRLVMLFGLFGLVSLWLSLPPSWGLSGLLHSLVSQFRVPNRAGIGVAFALIIISGLYLKNLLLAKPHWRRWIGPAFAFLVVAEFPPTMNAMPVAEILPVHTALLENPCGMGIRYPYVSNQFEILHYYYFLQRMRGSQCSSVNAPVANGFDDKARELLATVDTSDRLKRFVDCMPLQWVVFGPPLPVEDAQALCGKWGWTWNDGGACVGPTLKPSTYRSPLECLGP